MNLTINGQQPFAGSFTVATAAVVVTVVATVDVAVVKGQLLNHGFQKFFFIGPKITFRIIVVVLHSAIIGEKLKKNVRLLFYHKYILLLLRHSSYSNSNSLIILYLLLLSTY